MPEDINHLDTNDDGLKAIFGERFHDQTEGKRIATPVCGLVRNDNGVTERDISKKETPTTTYPAKAAQKVKERAVEAQWEPTKENTWYDNLKACAIWALGFAALTLLFFSWQQKGLMDSSVALPTMLVCTALGGWGVGKNAMRGTRR